jgi:hypothetical protein
MTFEQNTYDDEELDQMFGAPGEELGMPAGVPRERYQLAAPDQRQELALPPVPPLQMIPLGQNTAPPSENILTKKVFGVPVWALGLVTVVGGGGAAWWWLSKKPVKKNDGDDDDHGSNGHTNGAASLPEVGNWSPSRSAIAKNIETHFSRKGIKGIKVWDDAEEAKKGRVKHISPLVTVCCASVKLEVDKDLQKMASREGLTISKHEDGSLGCYPAGGKRGKAWEQYIDLLREDGQTI